MNNKDNYRTLSPLRYPGGKTRLAPFLSDVIVNNNLRNCTYYEPYAGGAGAGLKLLHNGTVSNIHLNDADPSIYAFWYSLLNDTDRFVDKIYEISISIQEWKKQLLILKNKSSQIFDIAFATFFLNRCNRSGIILGAGPIGGNKQVGKWKINARFNKETLIKRILIISQNRDRINISNEDAIVFLKKAVPKGKNRKKAFIYLDPPYISAGCRLYYNNYHLSGHKQLCKYIINQKTLNWIMSYDYDKLLINNYSKCQIFKLNLSYSLQIKRKNCELLFAPKYMNVSRNIGIIETIN